MNTAYKILVQKSKRNLCVYQGDQLVKTYKIDLGREPIGAKQFEGDHKTPEGLYEIDDKNPMSKYFLNLGISYPEAKDLEYARMHHKEAGGLIKIHGQPNDPSKLDHYPCPDWTEGCIALNNSDMQELYTLIPVGTPIEIVP